MIDKLEVYKKAFELAASAYVSGLDSWENEQHSYAAKELGISPLELAKKDFWEQALKEA